MYSIHTRKLTAIGRIAILILALAAFVCTGERAASAGPNAAAPGDPGSGDTTVTWHEGARTMKARMALDEAAVIAEKGAFPDDAQVRNLFHQSAVASKSASLMLLRSPHAFSRKGILEKVRDLGTLPGAAGASPVFLLGATRLIPTGRIICRFRETAADDDIAAMEKKYGLEAAGGDSGMTRHRIYRAADPLRSIEIAEALAAEGDVAFACPDWLRSRGKKALPADALFPYQWHLRNTGQSGGTAGEDINIAAAWNDNLLGSAEEVIAIVDDGLEIGHEDLSPNVITEYCRDFLNNDADPTGGDHGTSCAGLAAARGFNTIGVSGAAPRAGLAGLRIMDDLGFIADADEAASLSYQPQHIDIYSNSWGPTDPVLTPEGPSAATEAAMAEGVRSGRGGLGSIYVWAGGNGYAEGDNSNYDGYSNSRYAVAVAASGDDGIHASYSEEGANILVNAPSKNSFSSLDVSGIITTDRTGTEGYNWSDNSSSYTNDFRGTSAVTPMVAGVIALMLEANPNLSWRDVRHVLAETAEKNDPSDGDWTVNGAGYHVNHKYGFGRVDAAAAVAASANWVSAGGEATIADTRSPGKAIPDNNAAGVTDAMTILGDITVEHVEVEFSSNHTYWADLAITLTSPAGTESVLAGQHVLSVRPAAYAYAWRFGSVRHLGESSKGTWRLTVRDLAADDYGMFESWTLRLYGVAGAGTYTITAAAGSNGAIAPSGSVAVPAGADQIFTITPDEGFCVDDVLVDGTSAGSVPSYTFSGVVTDHTIEASFRKAISYLITATAMEGGTITPSGDVAVTEGADITFTITPDAGYHITDVLVDGTMAGSVATYTFQHVAAGHTIEARFAAGTVYVITASAATGGAITPEGAVNVAEGADSSFTITPDEGYRVSDVLVDGVSAGAVTSYTFSGTDADHTIEATFEKASSNGGSGKSGGGGGCFIDTLSQ